ncbi:MAG: class I SAM-dependent methyltransferase [Ktedonobacteraceae bacterium]
MSQQPETTTPAQNNHTSRRFFAHFYERTSRSSGEQSFMKPLREEVVGQAHGVVLEIGAGNGLNFAFYDPATVERVEASEPDSAMLSYARKRAAVARVPIHLTQASVESLPFADESFDSAVVTLVFCSVGDPSGGLSEVKRVLKPGGALLMVEHVRANRAIGATMQAIVTPITRLVAGNCHWNRDTEKTVKQAGFKIEQRRDITWFVMTGVVLRAVK